MRHRTMFCTGCSNFCLSRAPRLQLASSILSNLLAKKILPQSPLHTLDKCKLKSNFLWYHFNSLIHTVTSLIYQIKI